MLVSSPSVGVTAMTVHFTPLWSVKTRDAMGSSSSALHLRRNPLGEGRIPVRRMLPPRGAVLAGSLSLHASLGGRPHE
jgi:hypothetical protein